MVHLKFVFTDKPFLGDEATDRKTDMGNLFNSNRDIKTK